MTLALMTTRVEPEEDADVELAARLARGDAGALEEVIDLHQSAIARLANRLLGWAGEVDDIVQDIFLTALEKAGTFRGQSSLKTWLTVIALNRCRTHHRRRKIWRRVVATLTARRSTPSPAADQPALSDEVAREVRSAVAVLPSRDREVIVLLYFEHKTPAEIAELVGSSLNAIEVRLHRAKVKLRQSLQGLMKE